MITTGQIIPVGMQISKLKYLNHSSNKKSCCKFKTNNYIKRFRN
jgi:hypothetical protein